MTKSLQFATAVLAALWFGPDPAAVEAAEPAKPNVLMIFVDDLNCRLGTYGDVVARTPNIDALAKAGMRFDRAYCANPVCMPSRTAMLTGLRPETTKTLDNNAGCFRKNVPDAVTMPQLFARGGYQVVTVGKTFYSHNSDDAETDKVMTRLPPALGRGGSANPIDALLIETKEKEVLRQKLGRKQTYWGPLDQSDEDTADGRVARAAARFLTENHQDKPFFLAVGIFRPHLPFVVPKAYFDLYPLKDLPKPVATTAHFSGMEEVDIGLANAVNRLERERNTQRLKIGDELRQRITQAYYASISFTDAQIGVVLDALKHARLEKTTIVVLVSDHGFLLGEHDCWAKSSLYEESVRAPLLVSAPGVTRPGSATRQLVEFVDIYPSLAALCGLKAPEGLEGTSFAPLLKDPERPWKKAVFAVDLCGETMARTERWKLITWPASNGRKDGGLLFDVRDDPAENKNLYDLPDHAKQLAEMKALLAGGWTKAVP